MSILAKVNSMHYKSFAINLTQDRMSNVTQIQSKLWQEQAFRCYYTDFLLGESSPCSGEGKRPFPSLKGGAGGSEEQGHCLEPLSWLSPEGGCSSPVPSPRPTAQWTAAATAFCRDSEPNTAPAFNKFPHGLE